MTKICYPLNLPFMISQKWNEHPEYYNQIGMRGHNGWDFDVKTGTNVYSAHNGTVWFAGVDGTMSNTILIDNEDGTIRTAYAHLSEMLVNNGDKVIRGQLIALSGNTGRYTSGPHLHFGVHLINNFSDVDRNNGYNGCVDPAQYFDGTYPNTISNKPKYEFQSPLNYGMKNGSVNKLQEILKYEGYFPKEVETTGFFGKVTAESLLKWQLAHGIYDYKNEKNVKMISVGKKTRTELNRLYK